MEKKMTEYSILDTLFLVDIDRAELRQADNPSNIIAFDEMADKGTHYEFRYDPVIKNIPYLSNEEEEKRFVTIHVPQMVQLDAEAMAVKYNLSIEEVKQKTDFEIIVDQQLFNERVNGKLPAIDIAGDTFIADGRLQELRMKDNPSAIISLPALYLSDDAYFCYYNTVTKQVVSIDPDITELPQNVVMLKIPDEMRLDPVGVARRYETDERSIVRSHPLERALKAEVTPLSQTPVNDVVTKNKQKMRQDNDDKPVQTLNQRRGRRL